jgi:uncharacterized DUF497 family protein
MKFEWDAEKSDAIRIISVRRARKREAMLYGKEKAG